MPIPKLIHYIWLGDQPLPKTDQQYIDGWRRLNPGFRIRRWSEKDINLRQYPLIQKALAEQRWALAADIIRIYAVFKCGGIYLDTDVELLKPLKPLLKYKAFAGWESNYWFTTAIFGAEPHSPWIKKILLRYKLTDPKKRITTNTFLKTVHSPSVYAQDFYPLKLDGKTRVYGDKDFAVFAPEYFSPKHYLTGDLYQSANTIAFHHYASTWHTRSEQLKNRLSLFAYHSLGAKTYARLEYNFHRSLERQIRKELP